MKKLWATITALGMLGAGAAGAADPPSENKSKDEPKGDVVREAGPRGRVFMFNHAMPAPYWIGAMCTPADDTLRAQLGLGPREGLVVGQVAPDSPAARGGLKTHDVIVKVGDDAAADLEGLMKAVNDTGEKELKIEILRNGKRETLTIKPSKRPDANGPFTQLLPDGFGGDMKQFERAREQAREQMEKMLERLPPGEERNRIREWMERGRQAMPGQPFRIHTFGPGVVMRGGVAAAMPDGVKVTVKKEGDAPAQIHVERGDQKWDVAENEIDKLPEDLRAPIAGMLAPRQGAFMVRTSPGGAAAAGVVTSDGAGPPQVEIKIDEPPFNIKVPGPGAPAAAISAEVEALREQVKALEARLKALEKPAASEKAQPKPENPKSESKKKSKEQA
jgi:membrane-associated protease RseP (regulator of RpoE activity)